MGRGGYHSSRAEFLSDEAILKYNRNGGCFVTTKKAIAFVVFALGSLLTVILVMYFYGPTRPGETIIKETGDIEKLLNETLSEQGSAEELRLPKSLYPTNYKLWIHPILDEDDSNNFTFTGHVEIHINCMENTNTIILHADDLNITNSDIKVHTLREMQPLPDSLKIETTTAVHNVTKRDNQNSSLSDNEDNATTITIEEVSSDLLVDFDPEDTTDFTTTEMSTEPTIKLERVQLKIDSVEKNNKSDKLKIIMQHDLVAGRNYTLEIKFAGLILNNLIGLYKTHYVDMDNNVRWLATSHFQPIYARRVFPCFDEPNFKASFDISIARRKNMTALSNMPLKETTDMDDNPEWVWDHFAQTPPMSTYIVAFTVSDLDYISMNTSTTNIKLWAPKADLEYAQYALEVATEILPFMENYFGMKYPLPKLDMLAIPNFGKAAMENWGIISFRKSSLLFNPNLRSIRTKSFILAKIAHEMAHQWFGNLVTMKWWSDLWLNEGFGTFMAEVTITSLRPRWHAYSSIKLRDTYNTLYFDSLKSTHSIQSEISSSGQIEQIFDTIIYQKGSSLLKMLNYTLSQDVFKRGLHNYLEKYAYQSATQDQLWELYTQTAQNESIIPSHITVKALMNSWATQSGYPLITVTRNYSSDVVELTQQRMTEDANLTTDHFWYVPITYMTKNDSNVKGMWLENVRETELYLNNNTANDSWILLNIYETGFYRVNYDTRNWKLLVYQLRRNPNQIHIPSRGQLMDDAFQLANAGTINYTIAFDLVKYLYITEPNYIPWYSALRNMEELRTIISNYEYSGLYDSFILKLVKPMFNELGTENRAFDTQNEKLLRLLIVTSACKLRYGKCITWSRNQYYEWMQQSDPDNVNPISIDYRYIAQCTAIKAGGPLEWDFLWNRTLSSGISAVDLQTAYLSLGCSYDPWIINRYLEYALAGNISLEYVPYVWQSISHTVGIRTGFQFLRLNWDRIYKEYEEVYLVFSSIFHDFLSQLSTEVDLEDLTTFYRLHQNDLKIISPVLQSTVDRIKVRIAWKTKHLDSVVNWLKINRY